MIYRCKKAFDIQDLGYDKGLYVEEGTPWVESDCRWKLAENDVKLLKKHVAKDDRVLNVEIVRERILDYFESVK